MESPLRGAVIGVGYLGRFHAEKMAALADLELVAVVDIDRERVEAVAAQVGALAFTDHRQILNKVDLVSIAVPTCQHFAVARDFLAAGCHVLLEKPMASTVAEADTLISLATANNLILQIGHLERFNPAIMALQGVVENPRIVFSHRLAPYRLRGTDVSVVLDLMIHDIDIILQTIPSTIIGIQSVGAVGPSGQIDIANTRLLFANSCVANITASRVSDESMRQLRVFGMDKIASVDCQARRIAILGENEANLASERIGMVERSFIQSDPLHEEISSFVAAVRLGVPPRVSGEDGRRALAIALQIEASLESAKG